MTSGEHTFQCEFTIVHRDSLVLTEETTVDCLPEAPGNLEAFDIRIQGSNGYNFSASIKINPDIITDIFVGKTMNCERFL